MTSSTIIYIPLWLRLNTALKTVLATVDQTVKDVLGSNGVSTAGAQLLINGNVAGIADMNSSIGSLGIQDGQNAVFNVTSKATAAK